MKKIGIILNIPDKYTGGLNYYKNLVYAISKVNNNNSIEIILFISTTLDNDYVDFFRKYSIVVKTNFINKNNIKSLLNRLFYKITNISFCNEFLIKKYNIDILTHSYYVPKLYKIKVSNWIPDFQYLHYPELWTKKELNTTLKHHKELAENSDSILLSSNDALKDFKSLFPHLIYKTKVINFVSQPTITFYDDDEKIQDSLKCYTNLKPYFYLPNQFWQHKNHMVVFEAVKILIEKGHDFRLICSGHMKDFRNNNSHIEKLINFVNINKLEEYIIFLGLIPYQDVLKLIYFSKALVNPSLFEGWSSTVEEAKSIGRLSIISDIPIHREQSPNNCLYFNPKDSFELSQKLEHVLNSEYNVFKSFNKEELTLDLNKRTNKFGLQLLNYYTNEFI